MTVVDENEPFEYLQFEEEKKQVIEVTYPKL
jgi:hypothetical protein